MKVREAYIKFLQKAEKNAVSQNIAWDEIRFVLLFNEAQNNYVRELLKQKNVSERHDLVKLLVYDKELKLKSNKEDGSLFALPSDFFTFVNIDVWCSSSTCTNIKMGTVWEIKEENASEILSDPFNEPSLSFRETCYSLLEDGVLIRTKNFVVDKVQLVYYRYPHKIDIEGYMNPITNLPSSNIDPEFDDKTVDLILTKCMVDSALYEEDYNKFSAGNQKFINKL